MLLKHYKYITETFLLMKNKHRKLFVIRQSKRCKFIFTMHQNTFGGRAPRTRCGSLRRSPRLLSWILGAQTYF